MNAHSDLTESPLRHAPTESAGVRHFTTRWGPIALPQQVIGRALGHTTRIRLGTGVEVLYGSQPVRIALELAQLDHLGRSACN